MFAVWFFNSSVKDSFIEANDALSKEDCSDVGRNITAGQQGCMIYSENMLSYLLNLSHVQRVTCQQPYGVPRRLVLS